MYLLINMKQRFVSDVNLRCRKNASHHTPRLASPGFPRERFLQVLGYDEEYGLFHSSIYPYILSICLKLLRSHTQQVAEKKKKGGWWLVACSVPCRTGAARDW